MENKVTLSLKRYHELLKAEKELENKDKNYKHTIVVGRLPGFSISTIRTDKDVVKNICDELRKERRKTKELKEDLEKIKTTYCNIAWYKYSDKFYKFLEEVIK